MSDSALPHAAAPQAWLPTILRRLWGRSDRALPPAAGPDRRGAAAESPHPPGDRQRAKPGFVSLVGAGPGSADLITLRGLERLQAAEIVFYDRLVDPALLNHAPTEAECIYVGKAPGAHAWTQDRINAALVAAAAAGRRVVRLKCGDPGVFARGAEEAAALDAAGLPWEIVPGVTAAAAAAAAAGSFLTVRGKTDALVLTTGRLAECPALDLQDAAPDWAAFLRPGTTLAIYMGVATAGRLSGRLLEQGLEPTLPVEIVHAAGTPGEAVFRATLGTLEETVRSEGVRNPAMILIRRPKTVSAHATAEQNAVFAMPA
ncbi:MAG: uroporphyrinogen-III C-methyltransferase [Pseudomonadota bacterium]